MPTKDLPNYSATCPHCEKKFESTYYIDSVHNLGEHLLNHHAEIHASLLEHAVRQIAEDAVCHTLNSRLKG